MILKASVQLVSLLPARSRSVTLGHNDNRPSGGIPAYDIPIVGDPFKTLKLGKIHISLDSMY